MNLTLPMKTKHNFLLSLLLIILGTSGYIYSTNTIVFALEVGWSISAPTTFTFTATNWQVAQHQIEGTFSAAVDISNNSSTTQGFTATINTTEPTHSTDPTLFIGYTNLEVKTGTANSNPSQPDGITAPLDSSYSAFSGILSTSDEKTLLSADATSRNAGTWSVTPTLRITIPTKQKSGSYNATLTLSLS